MDAQKLEELKGLYLKHILEFMNNTGNLFTHITVFADKISNDDSEIDESIIHIPIPNQYLESDEKKDIFIDKLLPQIIEKIKNEFVPYAIGWASEATLRQVDKDFDFDKDNWKKIPVSKDVLMISIDSKNSTSTYLYEVKKIEDDLTSEIAVNKFGEISKRIELIDMDVDKSMPKNIAGRFSSLYKKLLD